MYLYSKGRVQAVWSPDMVNETIQKTGQTVGMFLFIYSNYCP